MDLQGESNSNRPRRPDQRGLRRPATEITHHPTGLPKHMENAHPWLPLVGCPWDVKEASSHSGKCSPALPLVGRQGCTAQQSAKHTSRCNSSENWLIQLTRVAAGGLHQDCLVGRDEPLLLRPPNHVERDAVLDCGARRGVARRQQGQDRRAPASGPCGWLGTSEAGERAGRQATGKHRPGRSV